MPFLRRVLVPIFCFVLLSASAMANDFKGWLQPDLPAGCTLRVMRVFQTADGKPIHALLANTGGKAITGKIYSLVRNGNGQLMDGADFRLTARQTLDFVVSGNRLAAKPGDPIHLSVHACKVSE